MAMHLLTRSRNGDIYDRKLETDKNIGQGKGYRSIRLDIGFSMGYFSQGMTNTHLFAPNSELYLIRFLIRDNIAGRTSILLHR